MSPFLRTQERTSSFCLFYLSLALGCWNYFQPLHLHLLPRFTCFSHSVREAPTPILLLAAGQCFLLGAPRGPETFACIKQLALCRPGPMSPPALGRGISHYFSKWSTALCFAQNAPPPLPQKASLLQNTAFLISYSHLIYSSPPVNSPRVLPLQKLNAPPVNLTA